MIADISSIQPIEIIAIAGLIQLEASKASPHRVVMGNQYFFSRKNLDHVKKRNTFIGTSVGYFLLSTEIHAMPSFARQTGMACKACHVQSFGLNLTPTGRNFKLNGYTGGGSSASLVPLGTMIRRSFTHTQSRQPDGAADRFGRNNNATIDEASIFYGGRITSKVGALVQGTYNGVENIGELDHSDVRFADQTILAGKSLAYGLSTNNSPTVSDLWNTTPVNGFPWASSPLAPTQSAGTLIEPLGGQVVGATAYMMWNNLLYVEGGGYTSLPRHIQQGIGTFDAEQAKINGGAPYWRVALQNDWKGHYTAIGSFGMQANVNPQRMIGAGTDNYYDFGFDATYQYMANPVHIFEFNATYIRENRDQNASMA